MSDGIQAVADEKKRSFSFGLTNNQLKIIAMVTMLVDHLGVQIWPSVGILRIIGRISFPIFAFMIAEGCRYTKHRLKYFLSIFILGVGCQTVYFIAMRSLYQNILIAFSLAILAIFSLDLFIRKRTVLNGILALLGVAVSLFAAIGLPLLLKKQGFAIDYGVYGVILPIIVYYLPSKWWRVLGMGLVLTYRAWVLGGVHWYTLIAVGLLALYNGKRGKLGLKYLFYIFYPAHLVIIYLLSLII